MVGFWRAGTLCGLETGLAVAFEESPLPFTMSEFNTTRVKFEDHFLASLCMVPYRAILERDYGQSSLVLGYLAQKMSARQCVVCGFTGIKFHVQRQGA